MPSCAGPNLIGNQGNSTTSPHITQFGLLIFKTLSFPPDFALNFLPLGTFPPADSSESLSKCPQDGKVRCRSKMTMPPQNAWILASSGSYQSDPWANDQNSFWLCTATHVFNPSSWTEAGRSLRFSANLVDVVSSRSGWAI